MNGIRRNRNTPDQRPIQKNLLSWPLLVQVMKIEEVKNRYKDEWVLVEILDEDRLGQPKEVLLLAHSKNRADTYQVMKKAKSKYTYHFYTGDIPTKEYAVAFYVQFTI